MNNSSKYIFISRIPDKTTIDNAKIKNRIIVINLPNAENSRFVKKWYKYLTLQERELVVLYYYDMNLKEFREKFLNGLI